MESKGRYMVGCEESNGEKDEEAIQSISVLYAAINEANFVRVVDAI